MRATSATARISTDRPLYESLTPREKEVASWLGMGVTYREIGAHTGNSMDTVKNQVWSILRKIGADSRAHAVCILMTEKHAAELRLRDEQVPLKV